MPHQNRIVRRTRVAVKNALMELIHEKNYPPDQRPGDRRKGGYGQRNPLPALQL